MLKSDVGTLLVKQGKINEQQWQDCIALAFKEQTDLLKCLRTLVNSEDIAKASALVLSLDYIARITEKMVNPALLAKIPLRFLRMHLVIPIVMEEIITLVTADPFSFSPLDELNLLLEQPTKVAVASPETILDAINRYYPLEESKQMIEELEEKELPEAVDFSNIEEKDILAMATEAPIIKLVNHILVQAVKRNASDIHIEPFEREVRIRYRIDGIMYDAFNPPKRLQGALVSRIKIMSNLNIAEKRMPQDGRIEIKIADKAIDIRVSILPVTFGERVVMRLLDKTRSFTSLKNLGFSQHDYNIMQESIRKPNGIIFVSGPTGSGKTSTLYSVLNELSTSEVNIITVEDPVEYQMPGVAQVQVKEKIGLTFAAALRSILRQDPDIIMIGEIRDFETAQIAIQAALTGHLVLSTIHTNSAPATITRLLDMGIEPFLIASSVTVILAQRLVRRLCQQCKQPYQPSQQELKSIGLTQKDAASIQFFKPAGCEECGQTGYKGRLAIFEIMPMSNAIAKKTMERADASEVRKIAMQEGMTLLLHDGIRAIKNGLTTIEEIVRVATSEEEFTQ